VLLHLQNLSVARAWERIQRAKRLGRRWRPRRPRLCE